MGICGTSKLGMQTMRLLAHDPQDCGEQDELQQYLYLPVAGGGSEHASRGWRSGGY